MNKLLELIRTLKAFTILIVENDFEYINDPDLLLGNLCLIAEKDKAQIIQDLENLGYKNFNLALQLFYQNWGTINNHDNESLESMLPEYLGKYLEKLGSSDILDPVREALSSELEGDDDDILKSIFLKNGIFVNETVPKYVDLIKNLRTIPECRLILMKNQPSPLQWENFKMEIERSIGSTRSNFCLSIIDKSLGHGTNEGIDFIKQLIKDHKDNKNFKPEDLFKRINNKPYPIKENTFEFWNACIDNEIVNSIKGICQRNSWLYLRIEDRRMLNEELVVCLCYLNYMTNASGLNIDSVKEMLDIYEYQNKVCVKIKNKAYVTQILEKPAFKAEFLLSLNTFEMEFVEKMKILITSHSGKMYGSSTNRRLDAILQTKNVRLAKSFYVVWLVLKELPLEYVKEERDFVLGRIERAFLLLRAPGLVEKFEGYIIDLWATARKYSLSNGQGVV